MRDFNLAIRRQFVYYLKSKTHSVFSQKPRSAQLRVRLLPLNLGAHEAPFFLRVAHIPKEVNDEKI